jgi:hypothetical protein
MVVEEFQRALLAEYLTQLDDDGVKMNEWEELGADSKASSIYLAKGSEAWVKSKIDNSDDEAFVLVVQYTKLMRFYRLFRAYVRCGDAITIEWLYCQFLPVFAARGKAHYFDICLGMIEQLYSEVPFHVL